MCSYKNKQKIVFLLILVAKKLIYLLKPIQKYSNNIKNNSFLKLFFDKKISSNF